MVVWGDLEEFLPKEKNITSIRRRGPGEKHLMQWLQCVIRYMVISWRGRRGGFTGGSPGGWCRLRHPQNRPLLWSCSLFSTSCGDFGTKSWSAFRWDTRHGLSRCAAVLSGTGWSGTPFPTPGFGTGCTFGGLVSSLKAQTHISIHLSKVMRYKTCTHVKSFSVKMKIVS